MATSTDPVRALRKAKPAPGEQRVAPYEMIKQAILRGDFSPGQPLGETALAEWCDVSRTPIREALSRLEQDGLVIRSSRGMVVRQRSPEEILDIYETRLVLEATAGRMAAERRTAHDLRVLKRLLLAATGVPADQPGAMVEANRRFHRAVWQASRNESLIDLLERLNLHLRRYPETTLAYPGRWKEAGIEHGQLVAAIESRDADAAYEAAMRHFSRARDIRLDLYDSETELIEPAAEIRAPNAKRRR